MPAFDFAKEPTADISNFASCPEQTQSGARLRDFGNRHFFAFVTFAFEVFGSAIAAPPKNKLQLISAQIILRIIFLSCFVCNMLI
jgi:hypothetical protein